MPADKDPVSFDYASARKIAAVVNQVNREASPQTGEPRHHPDTQQETLWAKLGTQVSPPSGNTAGTWEWVEVRRKTDEAYTFSVGSTGIVTPTLLHGKTTESWEPVDGGRSGSAAADPQNLALEFSPYNASTGDTVLLRRCNIKDDSNPTNWTPAWAIVEYVLTVGKFCSQADTSGAAPDCTGPTAPIYTDVASHINRIMFMGDDFIEYQAAHSGAPCDPHTMLLEWNGMTWRHPVYPSTTDTACHAKIVTLSDPGAVFGGAAPTSVDPSAYTSDAIKLPVYWTLTQPDPIVNDCACTSGTGDQNKYPQAHVAGNVYVNVCDVATTVTQGMTTGKVSEIVISTGLTLALSGSSGCANTATLTAKPCDFLPTITDGVTTTQVGTIHIGDGLTLTQNTADCPGDVTIVPSGYTGTQTVQLSTSWDGTYLTMTQVVNTYTNGILMSIGTPFDTTIDTPEGCG